jgi:hypothetical protein
VVEGFHGWPEKHRGRDKNACKPAIPDAQPKDLCEELALAEAKAGAGLPIMSNLGDTPRLIAHYGLGPWIKMQHTHACFDGRKLVIHYFTNGRGLNVELKFVGKRSRLRNRWIRVCR